MAESFYDVFRAVRIHEVHSGEPYSELAFKTLRLAFLFLRKIQFAEPVDRCDRLNQGRYLPGYLGDRSLNLSYELEEGRHGTEGDRMCCDARNSPCEGRDVASREAQLDHGAGEEVVVVTVDCLLLEVVLEFSEGAYGMACIFHRGDQGPVLDVLLDMGLDAAVGGADLAGETAHALDVASAEDEGYGHDDDYYGGETPVERAEEYEGRGELDGSGEQSGHRAGEGVRDAGNVSFETVEHVSRMEGFLAGPAAFHDLDEVAVSDGVAYADVSACLEVADDDVEEDLGQCACSHEDDERHEPALCAACRYIDQMLADPHMEHGHGYRQYADETDQYDAGAEARRCLP